MIRADILNYSRKGKAFDNQWIKGKAYKKGGKVVVDADPCKSTNKHNKVSVNA